MSPLSSVQQGIIGQTECAKLIMIGSGGLVEAFSPATDDEQRDLETHVKGRFTPGIAIQVKCSHVLRRQGGQETLVLHWTVAPERLITDPRFWYLFAYLDLKRSAFRTPTFLVPSEEIQAHARFGTHDGEAVFVFQGSMKRHAHDHWATYRVRPSLLGQRVLHTIQSLGTNHAAESPLDLANLPGLVWAGQVTPPREAPVSAG